LFGGCAAAYFLYRERLLAEKFGEDWLVKPATTIDPGYEVEDVVLDFAEPS